MGRGTLVASASCFDGNDMMMRCLILLKSRIKCCFGQEYETNYLMWSYLIDTRCAVTLDITCCTMLFDKHRIQFWGRLPSQPAQTQEHCFRTKAWGGAPKIPFCLRANARKHVMLRWRAFENRGSYTAIALLSNYSI